MFVFMLMVVIVVIMVVVMMVMVVIVVTDAHVYGHILRNIQLLRHVLAFLRFSFQVREHSSPEHVLYEQDVRQGLGSIKAH